MQTLEITRPDFSLYCPFTGAAILNEEESSLEPIKLPSVQAVWIDEVIDTPEIKSNSLRQAWEQATSSIFDATDLPEAMHEFLGRVDKCNA